MDSSAFKSVDHAHGGASVLQILYAARSILDRLLSRPEAQDGLFAPRVVEVANYLMHACERNRDVAVAAVQLRQDGHYTTRHVINVAILLELALHEMGLSATHRRPVLCAALTMNICMHSLQEALMKQAGPLTSEQRHTMESHPSLSVEMLRHLGVADPVWLECVAQHHESPDGKGYPAQLRGSELRFEARLIGLLDHYCALLNRNAWRRNQGADTALFSTLSESGTELDAKLGQLLTRTLGIYPAGTWVQLLGGEKGMVKRQGQERSTPLVAILLDRYGQPLSEPEERDTSVELFSIVAVLDAHQIPEMDLQKVWGEEAAVQT